MSVAIAASHICKQTDPNQPPADKQSLSLCWLRMVSSSWLEHFHMFPTDFVHKRDTAELKYQTEA